MYPHGWAHDWAATLSEKNRVCAEVTAINGSENVKSALRQIPFSAAFTEFCQIRRN